VDPLSDVLSLLKPRSYSCGGIDMGGDLSLQFPRHQGIKCYAVVSGERWLAVEGAGDAVRLSAGDCFLLPRGRPFRLASDLSLPATDALTMLSAQQRTGGMASINGGGDSVIVGAHFTLSDHHAGMLIGLLPPIVHIRTDSDKAAMRWSLERLRQELREPQPGGFLVAQHLAYMMLVQALRLHLAEGLKGGVGWLFALADRQMSAAITAMHDDPAHPWTLQKLAQTAGMSRSTFAQKFKSTVGEPPMEYLLRWRMTIAGERLADSGDPISVIALSLGYESESAFGKAFKRVMGRSPRQYGRGRIPSSQPGTHEAESTSVGLVDC
jgi:AraC-like DNA-binding protein